MKMNWFREIFSGANGKLSAKRVLGGLALGVALACSIYLTITEGGTAMVENLLMTIFILAASLLGLPAITGAWGKSSMSVQNNVNNQVIKEEPAASMETQKETHSCQKCENCLYYRGQL